MDGGPVSLHVVKRPVSIAVLPQPTTRIAQGGLDDDLAAWRVEIASAAAQGVRLFGVCTNGADLAGPTVTVTPRTRAMISLVLAATPTALIIPRVRQRCHGVGPFLTPSSTLDPAHAPCTKCAWHGCRS